MIDNFTQDWIFIICDECDTDFDICDDFYSTLDAAKREGWKIFKRKDIWTHLCPSCRED